MPEYVVNKLVDGLNDHGKPLKNSTVLVLGIAYKKNIEDMRESPALEIIRLIRERGGVTAYSDLHIRSSVVTGSMVSRWTAWH